MWKQNSSYYYTSITTRTSTNNNIKNIEHNNNITYLFSLIK